MAKKQVPAERNRNQKNTKAQNKTRVKDNNRATIDTKGKANNSAKGTKAAAHDVSGEGDEVLAVPSSVTESQNDDVAVCNKPKEDRVDDKIEKKKPKAKGVRKTPQSKEEQKPESSKITNEQEDAKNKGKKRSKKDEFDVESAVEEKSENMLYRFPMNRVSRIIKSGNLDFRVSQEAVFLINRASEKFLQEFCREAHACAFLEDKSYTAYNHLSSAVAKQKRYGFLSDFVPEKLRAQDALAQVSAAEK